MNAEDAIAPPTVFIVDDDAAVRDSLSEMIDVMKLNRKCYESAEQFLQEYSPDYPGCLVLDVRMPGMNGMELHDRLVARGAKIPVIIITGHGDISMCVEAMKNGAMDFLEKPYRSKVLRDRIHQAIRKDRRFRVEEKRKRDMRERFASLGAQEKAVLHGLVSGKIGSDIADELDVSLRTVQFRRKSIFRKLGISNRAELISLVTAFRELVASPEDHRSNQSMLSN